MKSQTDSILKLLLRNNNNFYINCYPYKLEIAKSKEVSLFDFDYTNDNENVIKAREAITSN